MSKLIYCNFESPQAANAAVQSLKNMYPQQMMSFLIDNSSKYYQQDIDEYAPQGIPTAVLNQLYAGDVPPQATSSVQGGNSSHEAQQAMNITIVKLAFTDDTPREVLSSLEQLGGTSIKSFLS